MKIATAFLILAGALPGQVQRFTIAPGDSNRLELRVYKTGIYRGKVHEFLFPKYQGNVVLDAKNPEGSNVQLTLAAAEIKLMDTWLSAKDFKSVQEYAVKDMLNVERFKEISFTSTGVRVLDATHFEVRGTLSLRGIAKPATLNVTMTPGPSPKFDGKAAVKLTDFGLKPPSAALGLIGTRDEMDFSFVVFATPQGS